MSGAYAEVNLQPFPFPSKRLTQHTGRASGSPNFIPVFALRCLRAARSAAAAATNHAFLRAAFDLWRQIHPDRFRIPPRNRETVSRPIFQEREPEVKLSQIPKLDSNQLFLSLLSRRASKPFLVLFPSLCHRLLLLLRSPLFTSNLFLFHWKIAAPVRGI